MGLMDMRATAFTQTRALFFALLLLHLYGCASSQSSDMNHFGSASEYEEDLNREPVAFPSGGEHWYVLAPLHESPGGGDKHLVELLHWDDRALEVNIRVSKLFGMLLEEDDLGAFVQDLGGSQPTLPLGATWVGRSAVLQFDIPTEPTDQLARRAEWDDIQVRGYIVGGRVSLIVVAQGGTARAHVVRATCRAQEYIDSDGTARAVSWGWLLGHTERTQSIPLVRLRAFDPGNPKWQSVVDVLEDVGTPGSDGVGRDYLLVEGAEGRMIAQLFDLSE